MVIDCIIVAPAFTPPHPTTPPQKNRYNDDYMDITNNGTEVGRIRLAQSEGARAVPQVFLAVGYDLNDDASPYGPVHFRDKQDVGRRLAQSALANVYGAFYVLRRVCVRVVGDLGVWRSKTKALHTQKKGTATPIATTPNPKKTGKWGPLPWGPTVKEVVPTWSSDALDADALLLTVRVEYADVGDGLVDRWVGGGVEVCVYASRYSFNIVSDQPTILLYIPHTHSGVNIFELAADADAEDYEEEVLESTGVTLAGPATAVVAFRVPKAHALAQADAAPVLRYAYRNRPCPERMAETPYVGAWCGLYSSEEQPALPFVRELQ